MFSCLVSLDQGKCSSTYGTIVIQIHKHFFCPIKISSALLRPIIAILLCSSVYRQRYFPAVRNRLTIKKNTCWHIIGIYYIVTLQ